MAHSFILPIHEDLRGKLGHQFQLTFSDFIFLPQRSKNTEEEILIE
jgi:hypothetical protein